MELIQIIISTAKNVKAPGNALKFVLLTPSNLSRDIRLLLINSDVLTAENASTYARQALSLKLPEAQKSSRNR